MVSWRIFINSFILTSVSKKMGEVIAKTLKKKTNKKKHSNEVLIILISHPDRSHISNS